MLRPRRKQSSSGDATSAGKRNSIVAVGPRSRSRLRKAGDIDIQKVRPQENWQDDAYGYVETVGELRYLQNQKASLVGRCVLKVRRVDQYGQKLPDPVLDPEDEDYNAVEAELYLRASRVLANLKGPSGGQREILRRFALNFSIAGEVYLLGIPHKEGDGTLWFSWEAVSVAELKFGTNGVISRVADNRTHVTAPLPKNTYIARLHRSDPQYSDRPDSEVRSVLRVLKQLTLLEEVVDSAARSRIPAGILFLPSEAEAYGTMAIAEDSDVPTGIPIPEAPEVELEAGEVIEQVAADHAEEASLADIIYDHLDNIGGADNGNQVLPVIVSGPGEIAEQFKYIDLSRRFDEWSAKAREEALLRMAHGLDSPPEMMTGSGGLNDWGAFQVSSDFIHNHVVTTLEVIAEFLTDAYLRPVLEEAEEFAAEVAGRYIVEGDSTPITSRRDETESARELFDRKEITAEALLRSHGFNHERDGLQRGSEEWQVRVGEELLARSPYLLAALTPLLGLDIDLTSIPRNLGGLGPTEDESAASPGGPLNIGRPSSGSQPGSPPSQDNQGGAPQRSDGVPTAAGPQTRASAVTGRELLAERITTASDAALDKALDRCASRVIRRVKTDRASPEMKASVAAGTKIDALHLARNEWDSLELRPINEMMSKAWDDLELKVRNWTRDLMETNGVSVILADDTAFMVAKDLIAELDDLASRAFRGPLEVDPISRRRVPPSLVDRVLGRIDAEGHYIQ